jgi:hypothetical protein
VPGRVIFREDAVEAYRRVAGKDVVPRLISGPITVCRWLLVVVLVGAVALAWSVRVPTYVGAPGVLVAPGGAESFGTRTVAVLFLPPAESPSVRVGRPVRIQVGTSGTGVQGTVTVVDSDVITPETARERHPSLGPDLVTQPSVVAVVRLEDRPPAGSHGGTWVTAQVETGSQRLVAYIADLPTRSAE